MSAFDKSEILLKSINGEDLKEASHFLRNIGATGLAILDRHTFKHLAQLNILPEIPANAPTKKRYLEIEQAWHN